MTRTKAEIAKLAESLVNTTIATLASEHSNIAKAIRQTQIEYWNDTISDRIAEVEEILLNKFGSID